MKKRALFYEEQLFSRPTRYFTRERPAERRGPPNPRVAPSVNAKRLALAASSVRRAGYRSIL